MAASVIASEVQPARRGGLTPRRNGAGPAGQGEGVLTQEEQSHRNQTEGVESSREAVMALSKATGRPRKAKTR